MSKLPSDQGREKAERERRRRNIAIAVTLGLMVIAFYLATFVRFGTGVATGS